MKTESRIYQRMKCSLLAECILYPFFSFKSEPDVRSCWIFARIHQIQSPYLERELVQHIRLIEQVCRLWFKAVKRERRDWNILGCFFPDQDNTAEIYILVVSVISLPLSLSILHRWSREVGRCKRAKDRYWDFIRFLVNARCPDRKHICI